MGHDLLLLSSSRVFGRVYLHHAFSAISQFLLRRKTVHFAPYARRDHDDYVEKVGAVLKPLGVRVVGLNRVPDPRQAVEGAEVLFVGGGNSFRLLQAIRDLGLIEPVRRRVASGELSYMGASAGTNLACPTIRTTNDMPIVEPDSLEGFGLVPFQVNPHYLDAEAESTHMGETREQRIEEFLEENDVPVLGMREGSWLRRQGGSLYLDGETGAVLFRRGMEPQPYEGGANMSFLLELPVRFDRPS